MIEINLAPGAEGRRSAGRRRAALPIPAFPSLGADARTVGAGALVVLLLALGGFLVWRTGARRAALETAIAVEVTDSTRFATTIELVHALRARQDTIAQQIEVIREVDQRRYVWPHLLDEISASVPTYTWLSEIRSAEVVDSVRTGLTFTVQGNAASTQALTRLMKNLEASPFIRDVTLITSEQQEEGGRAVHRFTLEAGYEAPDSSVIETVPIVALD